MDRVLELTRFDLWRDELVHWGGRFFTALLILVVGLWLARWLARLVRLAVLKRGGDGMLAGFLRNTVYVALLVIVVIGALDRAGVPTASLLAALGAAGLAIGLALRESLSNITSGVLLVIARPFRAGDFVDVGGQSGTVQRIDLLHTVLLTVDNRAITVPNAQVMNQPIVNFSAREERRLDLPLTVAHEGDPAAALRVIREVLDAHSRVLRTREPQLLVQRFGATGVELAVRPWVRTEELLAAQSEILAAIKQALDSAGVAIAYAPPAPSLPARVANSQPQDRRDPLT